MDGVPPFPYLIFSPLPAWILDAFSPTWFWVICQLVRGASLGWEQSEKCAKAYHQ